MNIIHAMSGEWKLITTAWTLWKPDESVRPILVLLKCSLSRIACRSHCWSVSRTSPKLEIDQSLNIKNLDDTELLFTWEPDSIKWCKLSLFECKLLTTRFLNFWLGYRIVIASKKILFSDTVPISNVHREAHPDNDSAQGELIPRAQKILHITLPKNTGSPLGLE